MNDPDGEADRGLAVGAPDPAALRRRVLAAALVSLASFLAVAYLVASNGLADWWLLVGMVLIYVLVVRPMMRPVREASSLRRSLAYQAFLDGKQDRE
jgi:small-conductance mechanosensitive channel